MTTPTRKANFHANYRGDRCIAVEREAAYLPLIMQRISKPLQPGIDFGASDSAESRVGGVA